MAEFAVLKEVYSINDECDQTENKIAFSIDDLDPECSNQSQWTMTPQVNIFHIFNKKYANTIYIYYNYV